MKEFSSLAAFAAHLVTRELEVAVNLRAGLEIVAAKIEETAKEEIGTYQGEVGGFPAWAPLSDWTLQNKEAGGYAPPDNPLLREGDLRESIKHETRALEAVIGSESDIAAWQELGTYKIPPRPFIGPAAFRNLALLQQVCGVATVIGIGGGKRLSAAAGYSFNSGLKILPTG